MKHLTILLSFLLVGLLALLFFENQQQNSATPPNRLLKLKAADRMEAHRGQVLGGKALGSSPSTDARSNALLAPNVAGAGSSSAYATAPDANVAAPATAAPSPSASASAELMVPMMDLTSVAERVTPAVVHIKAVGFAEEPSANPWQDIFGGGQGGGRPSLSSGSGVILSSNGYIVTNKHVVEDTEEIEVILNDRRSFKAKMVGIDRFTDIAVLKIDAEGLESMRYGDSDQVKVGEWVLAVGNPFNLASTVTAGIISAKARNLGLSGDNMQVESFLQTDAAVNPGNSGGALVNLKGELIGINTAIATPTGVFAGYSFALPVNLVQKVVQDILEFGSVQRGFLGVRIQDVDSDVAERMNLNNVNGVLVVEVNNDSAADEGGIEPGDIIIKVADRVINNTAELQEIVSRFRPDDIIGVTVKRNNKPVSLDVRLKGAF